VPVNQVKFFATFATSCSFLFVVQLNAKFSFANRKPRNQVIDSKMMNVGSEVRLQAVDGNYQTGVFFQSNCGLFFWLVTSHLLMASTLGPIETGITSTHLLQNLLLVSA